MVIMTHPASLFIFQALDSLQRAQELADGMGNKVTDVTPDTSASRAATISQLIDKSFGRINQQPV